MTRYRAQTNAPDPGHCVIETVPNDPGERIVAETLTRADAEMVAAALNGRGAVAALRKIDALLEADVPRGPFMVRLEEIVADALATAGGQ